MSKNEKVSAKGTYIFDVEDIEELDDLSLTSVVKEITGECEVLSGIESENSTEAQKETPTSRSGDEEINALLDDLEPAEHAGKLNSANDQRSDDVLLDSKLLYPDDDLD